MFFFTILPMESTMNIQNAYNEWSGTYDTDENLTRDLDRIVTRDTLANQQFNSIVEIGCGTGKNTMFLAQIGTSVHALDFSPGMIEKAREKIKADNVRFSMADLTKQWPCNDQAYDLITCNLVLEHIEDLFHICSEAARTLALNGRFFINELHPFKQYEGKKARFYREAAAIEVDAFVHHISDFVSAAETNGLSLIKLNEYWHPLDENKPPRLISFVFIKV
jgi:ubiquinone/menaquinone biosynthesis C-methylase UbiE